MTGNDTYILRYAKAESTILFDKMFYSKNIPFLQRKYKKALKIFRINTNHNKKSLSARVVKSVNTPLWGGGGRESLEVQVLSRAQILDG